MAVEEISLRACTVKAVSPKKGRTRIHRALILAGADEEGGDGWSKAFNMESSMLQYTSGIVPKKKVQLEWKRSVHISE